MSDIVGFDEDVGGGTVRARLRRRGENGSIAVLAAVVLPVVLTVLAVAFSTLIWGASESEVQRASDTAAMQAAASAGLVDFPYSSLPPLSPASYPSLGAVVPSPLTSLPPLAPCATLGNPVAAATGLLNSGGLLSSTLALLGIGSTSTLTSAVAALPAPLAGALASLPASCAGLGGIGAFPSLPAPVVTQACATAAAGVTGTSAPYSTRFYTGPATDTQPTCANGRVRVGFATGSPLLGFGGTAASVNDQLQLVLAQGASAVQSDLAPLGVRLPSTLPNAICPQVNVEVDQPVRGPVLPMTSVPNGRSSARRVVKNAVVVPVFNGLSLQSVTGADPATLVPNGQGAVVDNLTTIPAVNLNTQLLQPVQQNLLGLLDTLDSTINQTLTLAQAGVSVVNGTTSTVNATGGSLLPAPLPAVSGNVDTLNLLSCLRRTLREIYDPPSGDAPTVQEVLANAAADGSAVDLIQVGVQNCVTATVATDAFSCLALASPSTVASVVNKLTGLYDVPFLDVTSVMVRDVGNGNFLAVPVHASQASGAFRAGLVRANDERYAP